MSIITNGLAVRVLVCSCAALLSSAPLSCLGQDFRDVGPPGIAPGPQQRIFIPRGGGYDIVGVRGSLIGEVVKNAPYSATATTERIQVLADGNRITQTNDASVYRDSEGRVRREQSLDTIGPWIANERLPTMVTVSDPVANIVFTLDAENQRARILPFSPGALRPREAEGRGPAPRRPPERPGGNAGTVTRESLGEREFFGVSAEGTRTRSSIPAGTIGNDFVIEVVSEEWFSPELRVVLLSRQSDPLSGETTYRLENIVRQEPDRELFIVPDDYEVIEEPEFGQPRPRIPERGQRRPVP